MDNLTRGIRRALPQGVRPPIRRLRAALFRLSKLKEHTASIAQDEHGTTREWHNTSMARAVHNTGIAYMAQDERTRAWHNMDIAQDERCTTRATRAWYNTSVAQDEHGTRRA